MPTVVRPPISLRRVSSNDAFIERLMANFEWYQPSHIGAVAAGVCRYFCDRLQFGNEGIGARTATRAGGVADRACGVIGRGQSAGGARCRLFESGLRATGLAS